jgi:uncharacterized membrane protein
MPTADNSLLTFVVALVIGAGAGAAVGSVIGQRKGAIIGALVGSGGSALYAYWLAKGGVLASHTSFFVLVMVAALACGLMAGFFFAFSAVVMKALSQQPHAAGMAAMQTINVAVFNPWFGAAFVGTPLACVLVSLFSLFHWQELGGMYSFIGGMLYVIGTLGVTAVFNVPRNDALAAVAPTAHGAADLWSSYLSSWTAWNHVRTAAGLAASASLTIALCY